MRSPFLLLAAVAGFAAAQNSTDAGVTTGPDESLGHCVVACSERAIAEHSGPAQKCIDTKAEDRAACICRSDELVVALQACLTSTCPALIGGLNLEQQCRQLNGARSDKGVGMLPILVASGTMALGALFV